MEQLSGLGKKTGCVYDLVQLYGTSDAGTIQAIFSYVYRPYPDSDDRHRRFGMVLQGNIGSEVSCLLENLRTSSQGYQTDSTLEQEYRGLLYVPVQVGGNGAD
ncbi:MAG: hypothetical protein ACLR1V_08620 [Coprococcus sp.]